ncbi:MAG: Rieske (2Fe-2S) protein, partial [Chloroflexota bacterium]
MSYSTLYPKSFKPEDYLKEETYKYTRAGVESALTIIPEAYTCENFYRIEQEQVFANSWVLVGVTDLVKKTGDVFVADVAGQSIIVTRNRQGELRAFYNVCRHRGAMMLEPDCTRLRGVAIRCPYHSWAYDLNGKCIGTPLFEGSDIPEDQRGIFDMGGVDQFKREDYPLFPVHVDAWGCMIFVNLAENPPPLSVQLGDLPKRFANYDLEAWEIAGEREFIFN